MEGGGEWWGMGRQALWMGRAGGLGRSMHSGVRGGRTDGGQATAYHVVSSLCEKSAISLTEC
ncbi:MAG: hypothetical protein HFI44_08555 [Lachnospiraceae bacterium]|nr:hypothetical protein [Lachnospiraceae bacterium]